jgi:ubiquinone biosynthesis monooxygenase Coq7
VYIYRGAAAALATRRAASASDADATAAAAFVAEHCATEEAHLALFDALLPRAQQRSRLLPAWRAAGYALGFVPTLAGGAPALFATVEAVETFVEHHYAAQTTPLRAAGACPLLTTLLERCAADETGHREDAAARAPGARDSAPGRAWAAVVGAGSAAAVWLARRI